MNLWRITAGIALNRSRESRWRQVCVLVSAAVFTAMLLAAASVLALWAKESDRKDNQVAVLSSAPQPSDVLLLSSGDEWRGQDINVIFFQPGLGASPPPGLTEWPEPGEWAVSDALASLMDASPGLAGRYPISAIIGASGLRTGGDLLAYRVLQPGALPSDDDVLRIENGLYVGEGPVLRVSSFGRPLSGAPVIGLTSPSSTSFFDAASGVAIALVIPALVVLAVGLGSGSTLRTHRFHILDALGVPRSVRRRIATGESLILALPGVIVAVLGWSMVGGRLHHVPVVGHRVIPGDLVLPWWGLVAALPLSLLVVALMASAGARVPKRVTSGRPTAGRSRPSWVALVPAALAAGAFTTGKLIGGEADATFFFIGTAAAVVGTPLLMPALLRSAGTLLAEFRSPVGSLVGNGMAWDPARTGRPFVGLGAALVLTFAAAGYVGLAQFTEPPPSLGEGPQAVSVQWRGAGPEALSPHADELKSLVIPYTTNESASTSESIITLDVTCARLVEVVGGECSATAPYDIPPEVADVMLGAIEPIGLGDGPLTRVALGRLGSESSSENRQANHEGADHHKGTAQALVLAMRPLDTLDEQVRNVAVATLPVASVRSLLQSVQQPSPLIPWIRGGLVVALSAIVLACVLSLVDRLIAARQQHVQLVAIGASPMQMTTLGAWMFAAPYAVVCMASGTAGILICSLIVRPVVPMPWSAIGSVLLVVLGLGALGALSTAMSRGSILPSGRD